MPTIRISRAETDIVEYALQVSDGDLDRLTGQKYNLTHEEKIALIDKLFLKATTEGILEPRSACPSCCEDWEHWYEYP